MSSLNFTMLVIPADHTEDYRPVDPREFRAQLPAILSSLSSMWDDENKPGILQYVMGMAPFGGGRIISAMCLPNAEMIFNAACRGWKHYSGDPYYPVCGDETNDWSNISAGKKLHDLLQYLIQYFTGDTTFEIDLILHAYHASKLGHTAYVERLVDNLDYAAEFFHVNKDRLTLLRRVLEFCTYRPNIYSREISADKVFIMKCRKNVYNITEEDLK